MRVLDRNQVSRDLARRRRRSKLKKLVPICVVVVLAVVGSIYLVNRSETSTVAEPSHAQETVATSNPETEKVLIIKTYQPEEFKALYNSYSYPQTTQIETPPDITGDPTADAHIQDLATARGYALRSVPVSGQLASAGDDISIQQLAIKPLNDLIAAANQAGLPLQITSGFRSIELQRELFLERLAENGVGAENVYYIASGQADESINVVLETTAPPGYSRHHTGYTVDFQCGSSGLAAFEYSECYNWLAVDNYKLPKSLGWIPSYPKGATLQGPEPEPWEYIWVGVDALYE